MGKIIRPMFEVFDFTIRLDISGPEDLAFVLFQCLVVRAVTVRDSGYFGQLGDFGEYGNRAVGSLVDYFAAGADFGDD